MFTVAYIFRRKSGMSEADFHAHYRDVHGPLAAKLPGLIGYTQHPVRRDSPLLWHVNPDVAFDAMSLYTFVDDQAAEKAFASAANAEVQADSTCFIELDGMVTLPLSLRKVVDQSAA